MLTLEDMGNCFEGIVPATLATASADGIPNVTRISKVHYVDAEHLSISNQFLSKTARNIAANPRASLLLIDPLTYDQYRLQLVYERTERRGHVFERLRADVDALAALEGMQDVFRLRAADIFRVVELEQVPPSPTGQAPRQVPAGHRTSPELAAVADRASAATIANAAAGVVVGKRGTARLTVEELSGALFRSLGAGHRDAPCSSDRQEAQRQNR